MRVLFLIVVCVACLCRPAFAQSDLKLGAERYLKEIAKGLEDASKKKTEERRAHWVQFLRDEIDWNQPAMWALPSEWPTLPAEDRQALARWSQDELLAEESVFNYLQNLLTGSCTIEGGKLEQQHFSAWLRCRILLDALTFSVKLDVQSNEEGFRIVDASYIGHSLRKEMGKAIRKRFDAHGVSFAKK